MIGKPVPTFPDHALPEKRVEVKQALVLLQGKAIGHAGEKIADLAGIVAAVTLDIFLAPVFGQERGIIHVGLEQITDDALGPFHDFKNARMAIHPCRQEGLQHAVIFGHLGGELRHGPFLCAHFITRFNMSVGAILFRLSNNIGDHR